MCYLKEEGKNSSHSQHSYLTFDLYTRLGFKKTHTMDKVYYENSFYSGKKCLNFPFIQAHIRELYLNPAGGSNM